MRSLIVLEILRPSSKIILVVGPVCSVSYSPTPNRCFALLIFLHSLWVPLMKYDVLFTSMFVSYLIVFFNDDCSSFATHSTHFSKPIPPQGGLFLCLSIFLEHSKKTVSFLWARFICLSESEPVLLCNFEPISGKKISGCLGCTGNVSCFEFQLQHLLKWRWTKHYSDRWVVFFV